MLSRGEKDPRISQGQGVNGSGLAEGAVRKKRHSAGVVRSQVLLQCRWDKGILNISLELLPDLSILM